jgi:arylsulfatase A-like enzyme
MIRDGICLAVVTAFAFSAAAAPANFVQLMRAKAAGKPNLILIVAEDLGYGDLGCYGQQRIRTPNLDRMAGEGMRFTQWYAGSPDAVSSRAALLTGYSRPLKDVENPTLDSKSLSVATLLQNAGYKTCALGVWGLGRAGTQGTPNARGFDEWLGFLDADRAQDYYPATLWRNDRRQDLPANTSGGQGLYAPDLLTKAALNFIVNYKKFPFFLYLATPLPRANGGLAKLTGNGMQVPTPHAYSNQEWPEPERNKAAMITRLDEATGEILDLLDELELADETLVIVTSASGPHADGGVNPEFFSSAGELRGLKDTLYEGGLRVPFIARWKGHVPAGKVSSRPGAHWDFPVTAAEVAQTNFPAPTDGISVSPILQGDSGTNLHERFYWEIHHPHSGQALRSGNWKLIRNTETDALELYNLARDPRERHNVADEHPEVLGRLQSWLDEESEP